MTIEALARGERHAFVATDLLWLDGTSLADVPLLERKRLLEAVLSESFLARLSTFVRPSAVMTLVSWGMLGFPELSYRASNSRYLAGEVNPDWAIAQVARRADPHAPGARRRAEARLLERRQPVHQANDDEPEPRRPIDTATSDRRVALAALGTLGRRGGWGCLVGPVDAPRHGEDQVHRVADDVHVPGRDVESTCRRRP